MAYIFWPIVWISILLLWCLITSGYWLVLIFPSDSEIAEKKEREELGIFDPYIPTPRNCIAATVRSSFDDFMNGYSDNGAYGGFRVQQPRVAFTHNPRIAPINDEDEYEDYDVEAHIATPRIQGRREIGEKEEACVSVLVC